MERYVLTLQDREELQNMLNKVEDEYKRVARAGYESGSEQDGHHDEGFQLSKQNSEVVFIQLQKLQEITENCRVIIPEEQKEIIKLGNGFIIEYEDNKTRSGFVMSGYSGDFSDERKKLSIKSPLGKALFGKKEGESVEIKLPSGKKRILVICIFLPSEAQKAYL